jgi:hypothetical protein
MQIGCVWVDRRSFFMSDRESSLYPISCKSDRKSDRESDAKSDVCVDACFLCQIENLISIRFHANRMENRTRKSYVYTDPKKHSCISGRRTFIFSRIRQLCFCSHHFSILQYPVASCVCFSAFRFPFDAHAQEKGDWRRLRGRLHVRIPIRFHIRFPIRFAAHTISRTIRISAYFKLDTI